MYEVISVISKGEKSTVYLASAEEYDEPIVVKELNDGNPDIIQRIESMDVPYLPKILRWETEGTHLTVWEEYIAGETIDDYIYNNQMTEDEIVSLIVQVCDGLETLHSMNPPIIHRDLKPSNLIVTPEGQVKIIDFDASREYKSSQTKDTKVLGTESYAPPEQYGYSQTDVRSDIYSIGAVLNELLPKPVTPRLQRIAEKCMMFNPDARYQDVSSLKKALLTYRSRRGRVVAVIIAAAVIVCAIGVGLFLYFRSSGEKQEVIESSIDTMDWKTGTSVQWTYYYWLEHPEQTPMHISSALVKDLEAESIQIRYPTSSYTETLDDSDWEQDEYGFVSIKDSFLQTLEEDAINTLTIDYGSYHLSFQVCCIRDLTKASYADAVITPGYYEYLRTDPGDKTFFFQNTFGRKLIKFINMDTNEELDPSFYSYDEKTNRITFYEKLFDPVPDGEYLNYTIEFDSIPEIEDPPEENRASLTVCVRDHQYIKPEIDKQNFILSSDTTEDLSIDLEWNDAKDKLEYISFALEGAEDTGDGVLEENDFEVTEDSIIIHNSYLKNLQPGNYKVFLEFGDVATALYVTIKS